MRILIVGGTNVDIYGRVTKELIMRDSNIGEIDLLFGGVGKNIAENLARLNLDVTFLTVLGEDNFANDIENYLKSLKIKLIIKRSKLLTPKYLAIFDEKNDFTVGVNDMKALREIDSSFLKDIDFNSYDLLVIDANLSEDAISYLVSNVKIPIYAESISAQKVIKFKPYLKGFKALKCNLIEAKALVGKDLPIINLCENLSNEGLKELYLTDGGKGSYYYSNDILRFFPSVSEEIVNTSGAGDAFFSGVIYAKIFNKAELLYGNSLASIILKSKYSNNEELTKELLESVVGKYANRY